MRDEKQTDASRRNDRERVQKTVNRVRENAMHYAEKRGTGKVITIRDMSAKPLARRTKEALFLTSCRAFQTGEGEEEKG